MQQGNGIHFNPAIGTDYAPASPTVLASAANRLEVDLHVHTVTSHCGFTGHRRLLELTRAAGRGVLAVTDHDSAAGGRTLRDLVAATGDDILVLLGMELTTSDLGHVVVFGRGAEEDWGWQAHSPFPRHLPEHWVAIQAHPYRGKVTIKNGRLDVPELPDLPERVDAVEVWNGGDLIKKSPRLRGDLNALSRAYIERNAKTAVASSDSHRPVWVHSFFTRLARPIDSVDDLVTQIRSGEASPQCADDEVISWCQTGWGRREVAEWYCAGKDWRGMAAEAGYAPEHAEMLVARFQQARGLVERGATVAEIAGELGEPHLVAADYVSIVDEEHQAGLRQRLPAGSGR